MNLHICLQMCIKNNWIHVKTTSHYSVFKGRGLGLLDACRALGAFGGQGFSLSLASSPARPCACKACCLRFVPLLRLSYIYISGHARGGLWSYEGPYKALQGLKRLERGSQGGQEAQDYLSNRARALKKKRFQIPLGGKCLEGPCKALKGLMKPSRALQGP